MASDLSKQQQPTRAGKEAYIDLLWLLIAGAASTWWCVSAAQALSATFDEPTYLGVGLEHWRTGSSKGMMKLGTMPLSVDVQTWPLFLWEKWRGVTIDPVRDLAWILPWARAATLVFWGTLLIYALRAGRALAGPWGGRLAVVLLACEPVFLAHATLATSDIAVTACLLAFFFEYRAHRDSRWPKRVLLPATLYGIAILAKASALVFGVIGMLAIELERLIASGALRNWRLQLAPFRPFIRDTFGIVAGGLAVTFIYCGSDWATEPSFIEWAKTLPPGALQNTMLWTAEHLQIFSNAGEGLAQQIKHNIRGHRAYLLGEEYRRGVWYYFPVALTIKTTLPLLLAPVVVLVFRRRALWNWACLATAALLVFSLTCRVQIGIRFMLPLLALFAIGMAAAVTEAYRSLGGPRRQVLIALVAIGLLCNIAAAARVWPEALCYTNAAWGGTRTGYRWLSDSNYDWGQGLLELEQWRQRKGVDEIYVWYFGSDHRAQLPPLRELKLHSTEWLRGQSPAEAARGKCVAVSTTFLHGAYARASEPGRAAAEFFEKQQPLDRTMTFFIYDFRTKKR